MLNEVRLIGRVGKDPELRTTQSGQEVLNFSLATSERAKQMDSKYKDSTEWHTIVVWSPNDYLKNNIAKGSLLAVCGSIHYGKYQDKAGRDVYTTSISCNRCLILNKASDQSSTTVNRTEEPILDDDIPF